jgi:hypothetical protein
MFSSGHKNRETIFIVQYQKIINPNLTDYTAFWWRKWNKIWIHLAEIKVAWSDNLQLHQGHRKIPTHLPSFSSLLPDIPLQLSSHFLHTNAGSDSYEIMKSWHRSAQMRGKYNSRQKRGRSVTPTILELHSVASILWCIKHGPLL